MELNLSNRSVFIRLTPEELEEHIGHFDKIGNIKEILKEEE